MRFSRFVSLSPRQGFTLVELLVAVILINVGLLALVSGRALVMRRQIEALTNLMEGDAAVPWEVSDAPDDYISKMINGITGLRLQIESVEGIRKLSQNRNAADRASVLAGFTHSPDAAARALAEEMTRESPTK